MSDFGRLIYRLAFEIKRGKEELPVLSEDDKRYEKDFIETHIPSLKREFGLWMNPECQAQKEDKITAEQAARRCIRDVKVYMFLDLAYGDLAPGEQFRHQGENMSFIEDNFEEIEKGYRDYLKSVSRDEVTDEGKRLAVKRVINGIKNRKKDNRRPDGRDEDEEELR